MSVTDIAFSVTVAGDGTDTGDVYVMAVPEALLNAESFPQAAPVQPPESVQLTPLFCASLLTVAVKLFVPPGDCTLAEVGDTPTEIAAGLAMVIAAAADFDTSVMEVAVSVTTAGEGITVGAVYAMGMPDGLVDAESVPHLEPVHPAPDKAHVTPLFCVSFATVAVNCAVAEVATAALLAFRFNATGEGDCGVESDGELAQPDSSKAIAENGAMTVQKVRQENLDMSLKPRRWTPQNRILVHLAHPRIRGGNNVNKL